MSACILVLTDFSAAADHALAYAAVLAKPLGAHLVVLHVDTHTSLLDPELLAGPRPDQQAITLALSTRIHGLRVPAQAEVCAGTLAVAVAEVADRHQPALIVVGRQPTEDVPEELISSSAVDVLQITSHPLLVVPYAATLPAAPHYALLAADDEPFSLGENAGSVRHLFNALNVRLSVVHVAPPGRQASHTQALDAVLQTGITIEMPLPLLHRVTDADPARGIATTAATFHPDLLVLIARPRSFFGRLFHRSVTAQVVLHSAVPVLLLPATTEATGPKISLHAAGQYNH
ncbi:universal stress protein [Hymenobacter guriensis]|uniref:Universal stress protein n=1 Tax=Hymenobacter guriensis TaxID=2793065 RepID=A0ABS0L7A5_9BACT|nr:universal stress protein [Hymenobacter guriensis]MBG8556016.1 universal stress protein [Hymenobacter guriensis]